MSANTEKKDLKINGYIFPLIYGFVIGGGMLICLVLSFKYHFREVMRNHCRVYEYWPSVSSVIGDYSPERNVWRVAIGIASGPRFVSALLNYHLLKVGLPNKGFILKLLLSMDILRVFAAGGWTFVSSSEFLIFHEICFVIYAVFSIVWQFCHLPLFYKAKVKPIYEKGTQNDLNSKRIMNSYRLKLSFAIGQIVMFAISVYFFLVEHQMYCLPGGYSRYAVCEWILSACNILYDATCYLDFKKSFFSLSLESENENKKN